MLKKFTWKDILWNTYDLYMDASWLMIKYLGIMCFVIFIGAFYDLVISDLVNYTLPYSCFELFGGCVILFLSYSVFHFLMSRLKYLKKDR